jgi:hypothetical protein
MTRVVDFAALKHRGQRRKGAAEEPYYEHRGTVIVRDGEMVLEVEYPGGRPT